MKQTASFPIKEFIELKPKMYFWLVDGSSDHKKQRVWIKNVVATIKS